MNFIIDFFDSTKRTRHEVISMYASTRNKKNLAKKSKSPELMI